MYKPRFSSLSSVTLTPESEYIVGHFGMLVGILFNSSGRYTTDISIMISSRMGWTFYAITVLVFQPR